MHKGTINCECGQEFYYETIRTFINCIRCGKQYEVKDIVLETDKKEPVGEGD